MKKFFLGVLSSFLGAWIAILFLGVAVLIVIGALAVKFGGESASGIKDKSIATLTLKGSIEETAKNTTFDLQELASGKIEKPQRLDLLVKGLQEAASDDRIEALYIKCEGVSAAPATLEALREAVQDFKTKSKKKIYAYADFMTEGDYYVASVADSIFVNPEGMVSITGVSRSIPYMASLFKKIGVSFQIAKVGTYKSAVEPYIMEEMSEPARLQLDTLCNSLWLQYRKDVAQSRGFSVEYLDSIANSCVTFTKARDLGKTPLFDALCYEREMDPRFAAMTGQKKKELNFIDVAEVVDEDLFSMATEKDHIAVLYASGEISDGNKDQIDCYTLVPVIMSLVEDEHVKGLVLRVNSPGGSVFGSEQIADALSQFKKTGKPFIVSMGDYAASGGYWISCEAERIFASPMTVTGSIGIFGVIPNISGLMDMLGVSFQGYSTNPNGNLMIPFTPLNDEQMAAFTSSVDKGYTQFVERVSKGRGIPVERVRQIAEGRVYDGKEALSLKLVDELGGLDKAISWMAKKTGLKNEDVCAYPSVEFSFLDVLASSENSPLLGHLRNVLGQNADMRTLIMIQRTLNMNNLQSRLPYMTIKL